MIGYLRQLFLVAVLSGTIAGLTSWVAHMAGTTPLILEAEIYEHTEGTEVMAAESATTEGETHDHGAIGAFAPRDGWERNLYTLGADVLTGIGFGMAMVAGFALFGRGVDLRQGLLWGAAGFAAFALAPSLGLPPQLPGGAEAPLGDRQIWWVLTAISTLLGIAAIAKGRNVKGWALGALLIAMPHVVGAPEAAERAQGAPEALRSAFVWVAIATALVFWLALGAIAGASYKRFGPRASAE
jgi:cobalt transporter subunit CbtA